ncbi:MAG: thiol:disulfide interchange protein DsbA/DsbL [Gammaproteobacteria bacterium]|nr:MAG: thiol:disulfide interchange protein DsbA/DsbL [Gammaproteobacteria bacterium]
MRMFIALIGICFSFSVFAADSLIAAKYLEGRDYTLLETPVPTADPSKIEVVEAFSFTCPHCYRFEPVIEEWQKKQKPDVALVQIHMQWSDSMKSYQRGFYTAVNLKVQSKAQMAIFNTIHKDEKPLETPEAWADLLSAYGVSKQAVISTYSSFIISDMMAKADARIKAYRITSTPQVVVNGKYVIPTPNGMSEGDAHKKMLDIADYLVALIRIERSAKH